MRTKLTLGIIIKTIRNRVSRQLYDDEDSFDYWIRRSENILNGSIGRPCPPAPLNRITLFIPRISID